ncbi:hypothetical protein PXO_03915 [Xanthomonas oryzae pv. oryzae PXO99A]|uniref:Uncharacterized protein n=1 Tax=Xanthomonas oryzae pv. oryzae (strain PXO99A) TaxID=360094 RepID=A0A0K0GGM8_XANOP|nr:hypothetical protein PXO_03915 [Xanthomonas oryzae pv. oryzae PXO99A]
MAASSTRMRKLLRQGMRAATDVCCGSDGERLRMARAP